MGAKLGVSHRTLSDKLRGLSFSELEEFSLDIQRCFVLGQAEHGLKRILQERLKQWSERFSLENQTGNA